MKASIAKVCLTSMVVTAPATIVGAQNVDLGSGKLPDLFDMAGSSPTHYIGRGSSIIERAEQESPVAPMIARAFVRLLPRPDATYSSSVGDSEGKGAMMAGLAGGHDQYHVRA